MGGDDTSRGDSRLGAAWGIVIDTPATDINRSIASIVELYPFSAATRRR
jgi:hypothetical protein